MPSVQTAVATREQQKAEKKKSALRFVEQLGPQIARALPAHLTGDRMTRLALTAVQKTPDLAECSQVSFAGALLTAAAMGLEPNTPAGEAYLVPYKGEATLIVGYAGYVKLFWQHPLAQSLRAEAVYADDDFDYSYGTGAFLRHKPAKQRTGDPVAFYAHATLTTGAQAFVVLTPDEVKALRGGKVGSNGGIPDPQHWMSKKTCIRQLVKMLPKSPTLAQAAHADEQGGTELYRAAAAERAGVPEVERVAIEGGEPVDTSTGEVITPAEGPKPTKGRMDRMHGLLGDRGLKSDAAIHQALGEILGQPVTSRKDLTAEQVEQVITHLEQLVAGGDQ